MAITLGATPTFNPLRLKYTSYTGDPANQVKEIDPAADDADVIAALTALDNISNAKFTGKYAGRLISGQKGSALNALQNLISTFMVLNFTGTDDVSDKVVNRSWVVPAPKDGNFGAGYAPNPDTPGTGSTQAYLGTFIAFAEASLMFQKVDGTWVTGLTYVGGALATGNDIVDAI